MQSSFFSIRMRGAASSVVLAAAVSSSVAAAGQVAQEDAIRFLEQSSFGPTPATIAQVQQIGIDAYLKQQYATPATGYRGYSYISPDSTVGCPAGSPPTCGRDNYSVFPIQMQFYRNALTGSDQLRQRVAFALSQIFVVSGAVVNQPYAMAAYQNLLLNDAFGNFKQLLTDVTLSPAMGAYLNVVNNDASGDPNENYARELLQLFSIGLVELNLNGTPILTTWYDPTSTIPTYTQDVVEGFSHVFTGWTFAPLNGAPATWTDPANFSGVMTGLPDPNKHHDYAGGELLLGNLTMKPSTSQSSDLSLAIDNVFNNSNVAPFICKQLIQQLVTSNPSPAYVKAVAKVFEDDGTGTRGNMQAVITAILTHWEARSSNASTRPSFGKLREPALMIPHFLRGIGGATQSDGEYLASASRSMSEDIFNSPTVFNYYQPSYLIPGQRWTRLHGPPFEIFDASTVFVRFNFINLLLQGPIAPDTSVTFIKPTGTSLDLTSWTNAAADPATLIANINTQFFHAAMSQALINVLASTLASISDPATRARAALYLALTSPEYQVEQ
jgi:hypothetical protein